MSRRSSRFPSGYEVLVHGAGPHDVAISQEAKVELMKASLEQRAGMSDAVRRFASGAKLPSRMTRLQEAWYPTDRAPSRIRLVSLTPTDVCAHGFAGALQGQQTFFITGVELRDASAKGERKFWSAAGDEALRLAKLID